MSVAILCGNIAGNPARDEGMSPPSIWGSEWGMRFSIDSQSLMVNAIADTCGGVIGVVMAAFNRAEELFGVAAE